MSNSDDELGLEDTSHLTDADWAEINKLHAAHKSGGEALSKAVADLLKWDPLRLLSILDAYESGATRNLLRDALAAKGVTVEDLEAIRKANRQNINLGGPWVFSAARKLLSISRRLFYRK